jgi:hypothetical protein
VRQFDAGQGAAFVEGVGDAGERGKILVVPDPQFDEGGDVGSRVDLDLLGADHAPAALYRPVPGEAAGPALEGSFSVAPAGEGAQRIDARMLTQPRSSAQLSWAHATLMEH